jgi:DNA adenine methylase
MIKPFLKWAGGKTKLAPQILNLIPEDSTEYFEPFVGAGGVFSEIYNNKEKFPLLKYIGLNDINSDLINVYSSVLNSIEDLNHCTKWFQKVYEAANTVKEKEDIFYKHREMFNSKIDRGFPSFKAALFIFLNKTCFNGLFRVNAKGKFNVAWGKYEKPLIHNPDNLKAFHQALNHYKAKVTYGDYKETLIHAGKGKVFYLDPPYRPVSKTSSFNSYNSTGFNDKDQYELKAFCDKLNSSGSTFILSNSNAGDNFFTELYKDYRVIDIKASRSINSVGEKRGKITEHIITNSEKELNI